MHPVNMETRCEKKERSVVFQAGMSVSEYCFQATCVLETYAAQQLAFEALCSTPAVLFIVWGSKAGGCGTNICSAIHMETAVSIAATDYGHGGFTGGTALSFYLACFLAVGNSPRQTRGKQHQARITARGAQGRRHADGRRSPIGFAMRHLFRRQGRHVKPSQTAAHDKQRLHMSLHGRVPPEGLACMRRHGEVLSCWARGFRQGWRVRSVLM